jgi:hypothetical protein
MRAKFTDEHKEFMRTEGKSWSGTQLSKKFGYSSSMIRRWRRENGLSLCKEDVIKHRAKSMSGRTTFPPELDATIKEHYLTTPIKTIAKMIGRSYTGVMSALKRMELEIPAEIIEQRKQSGRIKKGSISFNKGKKQTEYMSTEAIARCSATRFKKGNKPHNTYEKDGIITYRIDNSGRPYLYIRTSVGKWELYHKHLWEKENGKVPPNHCLWFIDGNSTNVSLENLECITRKENYMRNSETRFYPSDLKELIKIHKQFISQLNKVKNEQQRIADRSGK